VHNGDIWRMGCHDGDFMEFLGGISMHAMLG
jgi:hypothetical protein